MSEPFSRPILDSVREGYIVHPGDDHQTAIHYDTLEGTDRQWKHHLVVTDVWAILLIRAMLREHEEHINRIAELEDAATSAKERYDAEIEKVKRARRIVECPDDGSEKSEQRARAFAFAVAEAKIMQKVWKAEQQ